MIQITIDDRELRAGLERLARQAANMAGPMGDIARALGNLTEDSFQNEASPFGDGWAALDPDYVARPLSQGGRGGDAHPILQVSGRLAGSVDVDSGADFAQVSAGTEYAAIHQFGGEAGRGRRTRIKARPYMPVSADGQVPDALRQEVIEILREALLGAVGPGGA